MENTVSGQSPQTTFIDAAAVDVGFFSVKYAWGRQKDGEISVDQFPSEVVEAAGLPTGALENGYVVPTPNGSYFVGKGVVHSTAARGARGVRDGYSAGSDHLALFRGALAYIADRYRTNRLKIRALGGGLPLANFYTDRVALQATLGGTHVIPGAGPGGTDLVVEVCLVEVLPQPMGTLIACADKNWPAPSSDRLPIAESTAGVADFGGGTFDWYLADRLIPQWPRCNSTKVGTLLCARSVLEQLDRGLSDQPKLVARVDEALRMNHAAVIVQGRKVDLTHLMKETDALITRGLTEMVRGLQSLDDIDILIFTSGGAERVARHAKKSLAKYAHMFHVHDDPVTSNVRGFFILAEQAAKRARDAAGARE